MDQHAIDQKTLIQDWIVPNWEAPANVKAISTFRHLNHGSKKGVSCAPFNELNLGMQVEDDPQNVLANRQYLMQVTNMPSAPAWMNQVHGTKVLTLPMSSIRKMLPILPTGDASFTNKHGQVCAVMTADCLPVLFCDLQGTQVAAAHAGWRGLLNGVLEATIAKFEKPEHVMAWLGPAIGPKVFEVGSEVRLQFIERDIEAMQAFFPFQHRWLADIYLLAKQRLKKAGVHRISGGEFCTFSDPEHFFSYRRDKKTGRHVSCIWFNSDHK